MTKLTAPQLADMLDAYAAGETPAALAKRYGVVRGYVHRMVERYGKRCPCCRQVVNANKAKRAAAWSRRTIFRHSANMC